jgi:hypothetical protein
MFTSPAGDANVADPWNSTTPRIEIARGLQDVR